jgi:aryl-alcohol dehydrogenase-like predicted oxidoreductase
MHYQLLGPTGCRVSEICLGTMTFGEEWGYGSNFAESKKMFDTFLDAGGNFIDTANRYTEGTSEKFLGELIQSERENLVIATKYTLFTQRNKANLSGNSRKNMVQAVESSLKRLKTDYIDLLYLHMWDQTTPVEEILRGFDDLVRSGKIIYPGISDTPAWIVAQANTMAQLRAWSSFTAYQLEYSLIQRTAEREMIPASKAFDMSVLAWSPLGSGLLTGKYNLSLADSTQPKRLKETSLNYTERNLKIAQVVVDVAKECGYTATQVALAWMRQKNSRIIPIIGARHAEQITDSLGCLGIKLPEEHMKKLNDISAVEMGFPHDFLNRPSVQDGVSGGMHEKITNHRI